MLLDPETWALAHRIDEVLPRLQPEAQHRVSAETHDSAVELQTGVAVDVPSALDDGVTFGRDGAYGVRWLSSNGFEIGALGKLQTQGYEADDSPMFAGLADRAWTVEVGPTFGWRGPVHVDWTAFVDLLRNQHGSNHVLRFSLPRAYPRGYLIPEIGFHRYTRQFVDYYYGVPVEAALPGRPAFEGEAANGLSIGLAWGDSGGVTSCAMSVATKESLSLASRSKTCL